MFKISKAVARFFNRCDACRHTGDDSQEITNRIGRPYPAHFRGAVKVRTAIRKHVCSKGAKTKAAGFKSSCFYLDNLQLMRSA